MNAKNIPKLTIVRFVAGAVGLGVTLILGGCYVQPAAVIEPAPAVVVGPDVVVPPPVVFVGPRYYRR